MLPLVPRYPPLSFSIYLLYMVQYGTQPTIILIAVFMILFLCSICCSCLHISARICWADCKYFGSCWKRCDIHLSRTTFRWISGKYLLILSLLREGHLSHICIFGSNNSEIVQFLIVFWHKWISQLHSALYRKLFHSTCLFGYVYLKNIWNLSSLFLLSVRLCWHTICKYQKGFFFQIGRITGNVISLEDD